MSTSEFERGRSFGRYIGMTLWEVDDGSGSPVIDGFAPVRDAVRGSGGGMTTGALLTLADGLGGLCGGLAVLPRWVVSTNVMLRVARLDHTGPIRGRARVLRRGRNGVVTQIELRDEGNADALVVEAVLTSAALDPPEGMPMPRRPVSIDPGPIPEIAGTLRYALGIHEIDAPAGYDAAVRMEVTDDVRNPWGIVHGGATALLVEAAADIVGGDSAMDTVLHFVQPGRTGPLESRGRAIDGRDAARVMRIDIVDRGAGDRRTATATLRAS
jgi:acyl-coenzyme A thioesterase PaaI-like protein